MDEIGYATPLPQEIGTIVLLTDATLVGTVEVFSDNGEVTLLSLPR